MKKYQFKSYSGMAAVCAMLMFASCGNDIELTEAQAPAKGEYQVTLTAKQESSDTRAALSGTDVVWQTGDAITVFDCANANCTFELTEGAGTTTGEFAGTLTSVEKKEYCAVYPAAPNATVDADHVVSGLTLPVEQVATPGGFDPKAAIMTARSVDNDGNEQSVGYFRHVCCFVQLTTERAFNTITFTANGSERIAGEFTATVGEDGISAVTPAVAASSTVSLVPAEGETEIPAGTYLIAILPGTLSGGFTINCAYEDVEYEYYEYNDDYDDAEISTVTAWERSFSGNTEAFTRKQVVNMGTVKNSGNNGWEHRCRYFVDLGLSVKWATCNVGDGDELVWTGERPHGYGSYFSWGETEPKADYRWSAYKWCNGTEETLTKYNTDSSKGVVDNRTELAREDDAAYVKWGGKSRMPTHDEMQELMDNCYWEWTDKYKNSHMNGYIVYRVKKDEDKGKMKHKGSNISPKGEYDPNEDHCHIFLPCAGLGGLADAIGCRGYYWTSTLGTTRYDGVPKGEWYLKFGASASSSYSHYSYGDPFSTTTVEWESEGGRCDCQSIRPVHP